MPEVARRPLEASLRADLSAVRVHTDAHANELALTLSARAVTHGNHIFLRGGEQPTDLALMGHEVAHVLQQEGSSPRTAPPPQTFTTDGGDSYEREARAASAAVVRRESYTVRERTTRARPQRLGISDALDYFADKANLIPGFRMFTILLGVNPINMSRVDRSAANILRALIEFIPGGGLITQALDNYGIFEKVGGWVDQQLKTLAITGSAIKAAISEFLDSLGWRDIFHLGDVWDRAKRIFTDPIRRIIDFAAGLVTGILGFIKDAILKPLAALAEGTRGYDLLKAVLGEDPITGEKVPRTAETLIPGFLKLIGQEEIWENAKKSNAIPRLWAWFQGALEAVIAFVRQIPTLAINAVKSLELVDIVLVPRAFAKIASVFAGFVGDFISWAGKAVWNLLEIIFDVVSPGALKYIKKVGAAFKSILKNPLPFVGNLVKAAKTGFLNFSDHFVDHLKAALIDWLTGSLPGVYIPKAFSLQEIVKFVLSVLGLSWANVRQKLVKAIGEPAVKVLETTFDIVVTLVREGPAAAWDKIKEQLSNLKEMVISGITDFVKDMIVKKAVPKLIAMFIPGAGFISAILSIYDTIMVFVEKIKKIIEVVTAFIDSLVEIAEGAIGNAAKKVESTLAGLLTLAVSFLAGFIGLGRVADKVMAVIQKIRAPIDKAIDWLIGWIVGMAKKVGKLAVQAGVPQDPNERVRLGAEAGVVAVNALRGTSITAALINPALGAIKVRYGLKTLVPIEVGGDWWVEADINPRTRKKTSKRSGPAAPVAPGTPPGVWPVAARASISVRVGEGRKIEKVSSINPNNTITYTLRGGTVTTGYDVFMGRWNVGDIRPGGMSNAEMRAYLTERWGSQVASAILNRADLAKNIGTDLDQAHHIIPIEILGRQGMVRELVKSGWDFNEHRNGVPLAKGFHGNHPAYTDYVDRRVSGWVAQHNGVPIANAVTQFRSWVIGVLLPELGSHIERAKQQFAATNENLNAYFARL